MSGAAEHLRRASDLLGIERFFALSSDLLCVATVEGRFLRLSDSWQRLLGHTIQELISEPFLHFVHPDDQTATITQMGCVRDGNVVMDFVNRYRTKSGGWRHLSWRTTTVTEDGLIFAVARDVTEDIRAKTQLAEEKARLRAIMDTIPDLVFIKDSEFRYLCCNPPFEEFMGRTEEDLIGKSDFDLFEPEVAQFFRDHDVAMLETGKSRRNEEWVDYPDGRRLLLDTMKTPYRDVRGKGLGVVGVSRDITERSVMEKQLREREALYAAAIETSADGFWQLDAQGRILDVNSAYARMSGYSKEELRTMRVGDLDALEAPEDTAERIAKIMAAGSVTFETRHRRKDGTLWDVEVVTLYSEAEGGRLFAFLRDLRRRRRAEALLKTRLRLAEVGRSGDIDLLMTEVLDAAERLTASSIGFFHFVDPDQKTLTLQAWSTNTLANMCKADGKGLHYPIDEAGLWADCLRQGRAMICNEYAAAANKRGMPDGHAPVTRFISVPVKGENGFVAVIGVGNKSAPYDQDDLDIAGELAGIAMDIVDWVRAERNQRELALEVSRGARLWTAAMDSFDGGVAILDQAHRLIRANSAFYAMTRSDSSRMGKQVHCLAPTDSPMGGCGLCDIIRNGVSGQIVLEPHDPGNPSGLPLELRLSPIPGADSLILSLYDLTAVREQEVRLQNTIAELASSNAELERFAQVAAHDLQEPTRRQAVFAQMLHRQLADKVDADSLAYLDFILADALKMRDMVRELGVYSEAGRSAHPLEPVNADKVLDDVQASLAHEIQLSGAAIARQSLGVIQCQRPRLQLLLMNLLSNALKFRHPERQLAIRIETERADDGGVVITVADNGVGVPEEYRPHLFTLFRRLSSTEAMGGTGMGLAQCRIIVQDLGGRIWLEGNEDGGTSVKIQLPRRAISPSIP